MRHPPYFNASMTLRYVSRRALRMRRRQQARCASPARLRSLRPRGHAFFISIHYPAAHIGTTEFPPPVVGAEIIKSADRRIAGMLCLPWSARLLDLNRQADPAILHIRGNSSAGVLLGEIADGQERHWDHGVKD